MRPPLVPVGVVRAFVASTRCCHQTMIGLAIAMVEYVPTMMPMNKASENPRSTSPPNKTSARRRGRPPGSNHLRDKVWLMASLVIV